MDMCQSMFLFGRLQAVEPWQRPSIPAYSTIMCHKAAKVQQELDDYVCEFFRPAGSTAVCRIMVEYVGNARVRELVRDHVIAEGAHTSTQHIAPTIILTGGNTSLFLYSTWNAQPSNPSLHV